MKKKVLVFVDLVAHKNKLQIELIQQLNWEPVFFVNTYRPHFDEYFSSAGAQILLATGFASRIKQVFSFFKKNKETIHHLEIYPGGRISFIYLFLAKWFSLKTICAERGDLLYFNKGGYDFFTRFSMYCCYKFSNIVWYREPYMKEKLEKLRKKNLYFLHNAIPVESHPIQNEERDIDFLWVNRIIPQRKAKWFIQKLSTPEFKNTKNILVGILQNTILNPDVEYVIKNSPENLTLVDYTSTPESYFKRAKYFVLPSDIVFANHALLEAMSWGVVPLVSDIGGANLIVEKNKNGFIFEHTQSGFNQAMDDALHLDTETYLAYSKGSKKKIREVFSTEKYAEKLKLLYDLIENA
ncbi:MAG: glycosyltransferase [Niastella sp.]|nr:glycosyltransferase [Niastella sp.]